MKRKTKGFTLVELIVVIAIIAVLAAILVPAMMGWIKKAKLNTANGNAKEVAGAAQTVATALSQAGKSGWEDGTGRGFISKSDYTGAAASFDDTYSNAGFANLMAKEMPNLVSAEWYVIFTSGGEVKSAAYAKTSSDTYYGGYPVQFTEPGADANVGAGQIAQAAAKAAS